jgi:hypothetical protein
MEPSPWIQPAPVIQKFSVILKFSDFCIDTLHILNPSEMEECRNLKLDVFFVCFRVKADAPRSQMAPEITEDTKRGGPCYHYYYISLCYTTYRLKRFEILVNPQFIEIQTLHLPLLCTSLISTLQYIAEPLKLLQCQQ